MGKNNIPDKVVQSVLRASAILECLSSGTDKLTDIADRLKLSYGTTHRLLKTLELAGMVTQQIGGHRYYLGPVLAKIGTNPLILHQNIIDHAKADMERLWDISKETVALFILIGGQRILLKQIQSSYELRFVMEEIPIPVYPDPGGIGKTLLSFLSNEELDILMKNAESAFQQELFEEPEHVKSDVEYIRQNGFFVGSKKAVEGAVSISAPVKNYIYPAVVSVIGPGYRITLNTEKYSHEVIRSAAQISAQLG